MKTHAHATGQSSLLQEMYEGVDADECSRHTEPPPYSSIPMTGCFCLDHFRVSTLNGISLNDAKIKIAKERSSFITCIHFNSRIPWREKIFPTEKSHFNDSSPFWNIYQHSCQIFFRFQKRRSINQSIERKINQSINQSSAESINQSIERSIYKSNAKSINQSVEQPKIQEQTSHRSTAENTNMTHFRSKSRNLTR